MRGMKSDKRVTLKKAFLLIAIFAVALSFLYFKNGHYVPVELRIYGAFPGQCHYKFSWDTGGGFNSYQTVGVAIDSAKEYQSIILPFSTVYGLKLIPTDSLCGATINKITAISEVDTVPVYESINAKQAIAGSENGSVIVSNLEIKHTRFEPRIFALQVFLALLITWIIYLLVKLRVMLNKPDWRSVGRFVFLENGRKRFWLFFAISFTLFFCWLLGQWPGALTPDSLWQWMQTKNLDLQDDHPYVSSLYVFFLSQLMDTPAVVGLFQILMMSVLGSFILWYLNKNGLKSYLTWIFLFIWVLSIPICTYNVTLWKDIPFSILNCFWAFLCYYLYNNKQKGRTVVIGVKPVLLLSVVLIFTGFVRHNGVLLLPLIPLAMFVFRLLERRKVYLFSVSTLILYLILKLAVPPLLDVKPINPAFSSLSWKINPIASLFHNKLMQLNKTYYSDDYERDIRIFSKIINVDSLKRCYVPEHGSSLIMQVRTDLSDETVDSVNNLFYRLIAVNLPAYFADRAYLFTTMAASLGSSTYSNYIVDNEYIHNSIASYHWPGKLTLFEHPYSPKIGFLSEIQNWLIGISSVFPFRLAVWNHFLPIFLLLLAFFLYKYVPASALGSFIILFQVPFIIVTAGAPDFRYLYFVYIYSIFIIPMAWQEYRERRKAAC